MRTFMVEYPNLNQNSTLGPSISELSEFLPSLTTLHNPNLIPRDFQ